MFTYLRQIKLVASGAQLARRGWGLPCLFLKTEKQSFLILYRKSLNLGNMCPISVHLCVKFLFKMQFESILEKTRQFFFFCWIFLLCVTYKTFIEVPPLKETCPAAKKLLVVLLRFSCLFSLFPLLFSLLIFNPSRPNPGRKEKIKLNFILALLCSASKGF